MLQSNRICPVCNVNMQTIIQNWVEIDICNSCWWTFFDFWELVDFIDTVQTSTKIEEKIIRWDDKKDHENILFCPSCSNGMEEKEYLYDSWIHVNFCKNCYSLFLDKWEISSIIDYINTLETSEEGKQMYEKWLKLDAEAKNHIDNNYLNIRKKLDDMYKSDDILWLDIVVDFIFRKFY